MKKLIVLMLIMLPAISFAQENKKESPLNIYGFVRNDFFLDTYQGINAFDDIFYLLPHYVGQDANGNDINEQTTANFMSIVTRFGLKIAGPELLGAKTSAVIEMDFAGKPNYFTLRLRKAYAQFDWTNSSLLVGQTWHPLWGGHAFPRIAALNTGAPFQTFNRSPQMRLDLKSQGWKLGLTGLYQHQYVSSGPIGNSTTYKRDAVIPEMVASLDYDNNGFSIGAAADYNILKPRLTTEGSDGIYNTDETIESVTYMAYTKIAKGKLMMLAKGYYGQNMSHLLMLGGYGVSIIDAATGKETYTNYNGTTALFNITYGDKFKPGLFLGYSENLGTDDSLFINGDGTATTYGLFPQIQSMYRVSPSISYILQRFWLQAEYEMTSADYGVGSINSEDGLFDNTHTVVNNGVRVVMTYFF